MLWHMHDNDELIGSADACRILDIHPATLGRWVASGKITAASKLPKKNGAYVFRRAEVERLASELATAS
jgi:predicted site-specific integrase-resolvase